uniref:Uncharacterized protein n=1 Tax=Rhizophora mucronata TaxID=61149 RepID=A0A2P2PXH2_RHIMU
MVNHAVNFVFLKKMCWFTVLVRHSHNFFLTRLVYFVIPVLK